MGVAIKTRFSAIQGAGNPAACISPALPVPQFGRLTCDSSDTKLADALYLGGIAS